MRRADLFVTFMLVLGAGALAQKYAEAPSNADPLRSFASHEEKRSVLRVGVEGAFPPFNEKRPDGRLEGLDIDVAEALCERLKRHCIFVIRPWQDIVDGLAARDYDTIISSLRKTPAHDKRIAFTQAYYRTPGRFAVRKDSALATADEQNLRGARVAVSGGTMHQRFLEVSFAQADITALANEQAAQEGLARGEYDAVFGDSAALYAWLKTPQGQCCRLLDPGFDEKRFFGDGIGAAFRTQDRELLDKADKALDALRNDGTLKNILGKYFPFPLI